MLHVSITVLHVDGNDTGIAMRHEKARVGILADQRFQVEQVCRSLRQPEVRRPSRVQEPQHAVVVREGAGEIGVTPPRGVGRYRESELLPVEVQPEHHAILDRAVRARDVTHALP
jgi:hypothetical protein